MIDCQFVYDETFSTTKKVVMSASFYFRSLFFLLEFGKITGICVKASYFFNFLKVVDEAMLLLWITIHKNNKENIQEINNNIFFF